MDKEMDTGKYTCRILKNYFKGKANPFASPHCNIPQESKTFHFTSFASVGTDHNIPKQCQMLFNITSDMRIKHREILTRKQE